MTNASHTSDVLVDEQLSLPRTIAELPFFATGRFPKPTLVGQCRNGEIVYTSGRDLLPKVRDISLGLQALGMSRGDHVAIVSESRPDWLFADFAIITAGAVTIPIYPTLSVEQVAFILRDAGVGLAVVSTAAQVEKVLAAAASAPALSTIVSIDPDGVEAARSAPGNVRVLTLADVAAMGHAQIQAGWGKAREYQQAAQAVRPEDVATIIYTSGTTGDPKGVMLTHGNLVANLTAVLQTLDLSDEDVALSFLPLCHAFERMVSYVYMASGISMVFAESIDTIPRDLLLVRPTVMTGVPRVFEKLRARIHEKAQAASLIRRRLFHWAVSVAIRRGTYLSEGRSIPPLLAVWTRIADTLVFAKIRAGVGGRLRYAVSGSAPLDPDIARFFYGAGLPILEGYGLTETAPVLCVMPKGTVRPGSVGPALPNVELKIADDGEILARGPNVMKGYFNRPEETAAVLRDGWFHTGDIGTFDQDGFLRITDRKKDVLVTSGGKKIAPQPIEQRLRAHVLITEAILVGDRRHFPAALLIPDFAALGARLGSAADDARGRVSDSDVQALYQAAIDAVNRDLAQFERVKKFTLVTADVSIASGLLTPTMKVKRRVAEERFRDDIERMYGG